MATRIGGPAAAGAGVATVGVILTLATLGLTLLDLASTPADSLAGLDKAWTMAVRSGLQTVGLLTLSLIGGLVIWRQPRNLFSWLGASTVLLLALSVFAAEYAVHGLVIDPGALPLADVAARAQKMFPGLVSLGAILIVLVFPDGRLKSRRWRLVALAAGLFIGAEILAGFDDPYPIRVGLYGTQPVPVTVAPSLWAVGASLGWASGALVPLATLTSLAAGAGIILRMRSTEGEARQQLKWFAYAASLYFVASVFGQAAKVAIGLDWIPGLSEPLRAFASSDLAAGIEGWGGIASGIAGMVMLPVAIGVAMLRYRLYDIDVVINRTLLYVGLAAFVTLSYAIVVAGVGSLLGQRVGANPLLSVITIAVVAALLLPVRSRLQALANAAVYGRRARPYDVLSDFAGSVGQAEPADVLLPRMAELLREGTGASSTEVWVKVGNRLRLAASAPSADGLQHPLANVDEVAARFGKRANVEPVFHDGELLGVLVIAKPRGDELTGVERRLFHDLASQAGLVLVRFRLVQELRESRSRIVAAQDLERRRIERNLHDGAQQRFVNALLALGMAEAEPQGPGDGRDLLREASREVKAGLGELRDLARGLQPPLLAESGLVAATLALADRAPIVTTVVAETDRRYAERVETAAYFVLAEALSNAAKHSGAKGVEVRIGEKDGWLRVAISDDGVGGADPSRGSGIIGLHDRVAAAGGRLVVESPGGGGTVVTAELPCE